jgi:hypothetical protein
MIVEATTFIGIFVFFFVAFISIVRFMRHRKARSNRVDELRCSCGYILHNLEIPRCPECGCLVGFDNVKLADLGLTEEELRAYREKRNSEQSIRQSESRSSNELM